MTTTKEQKIGTLRTDSDGPRIYIGGGVNGDGWLWLADDAAQRLSALLRPTWRPMSECPVPSEEVRLLVENTSWDKRPRCIVDATRNDDGDWYDIAEGEGLEAHLRPIAWKPADSTDLPSWYPLPEVTK